MSPPKNAPPARLPEEHIGSPRWRSVVALALAVVLGAVLLNVAAAQYLRHYGTNLGYRMVQAKYGLLEDLHGEAPADWLILGDSSGAHGIVPTEWSSVTGGTTHNLAILANLLVVNDAWMLEEYLDRVGTPKNVVLVHAHDVWRRGYNSALIGQIPRPFGFWSRRAPSLRLKDAHVKKVFLSRFFPLMSQSETLRAHLANGGPDRDIGFSMTEHGWIPGQPHSPGRLKADAERTVKLLRDDVFEMSSHNQRALRVLTRLAESRGFTLYITHAPMLADVARREEFQGYTQTADHRIQHIVGDSEHVVVVPDVVRFPTRSMEAYADHVTPEAAPRYTRQLATLVQEATSRPKAEARTFSPPEGIVLERRRPVEEGAEPVEEGADTVSLLFGGDTSFARGIDQSIRRAGGDPAVVFEQLKPLFDRADLTFLNLECVLSDSPAQPADKTWRIRAPTRHARALAEAGVDLVSVANNHTLDFGEQGFSSTLATLEDVGVDYVGVQYGDAPEQPLTIAKLGDQTFGFLAYTDITKWKPVPESSWKYYWPKPANYDADAIVADIERARGQVDHLIVSLHWGDEYSMTVEDDQRTDARRFIDAGAELIVGHHPHVPRIVEEYQDGLIIYSLGDLLFDKSTPFKSVRNRRRFMVQVDYTSGKRAGVTLHPIHSLDDHIPYPKPDLPVDSWMPGPVDTPWRATDALPSAQVSRTRGASVQPCERWTNSKPTPRNNGYLQWLRPRFACPGDKKRPWETVAVSGDRSAAVYKRAIWAHPHPGGPLTLRFDNVPLGATLGGIAGVPDWPLTLVSSTAPPIELTVSINGEVVQTLSVPYRPGWVPFTIDTGRWQGTPGTVTVAIEGGDTDETGFTFDLMVDAQP